MTKNGAPAHSAGIIPHSTLEIPDSKLTVLAWPAFENKTGNPYTRLLYEAMEAETDVEVEETTLRQALTGQYDVWHVHWPDDFLSYRSVAKAMVYVAVELILIFGARLRGASLVWTVHDLGPHESRHPILESVFWTLFIPMVDGIISLSETAREEAYDEFPALRSVPSKVVAHGHYRSAYPDSVSKDEARGRLQVSREARMALFIGRIRPYKNVVPLIKTFRKWEEEKARLLVAGNPVSDELAQRIHSAAQSDARVRTELRFIEEDEMPVLCGASDLVVLPYETIMHSGSALLALSFDRPVLVPSRGAMKELQDRVGSKWIRTYSGDLTPDVLSEAMNWADSELRPDRAPVDDLEWSRLARQTVVLYRRVLEADG